MYPSNKSDRQPGLDWMRGCAALAVVLFHYLYRGPKKGWVDGQVPELLSQVASFGYLGVHLFFMISGYVIMMTSQNASLRQFLASRVARLVPAFWVCMSITALVELLVPSAPFQPVSWLQYMANLTLVPSWFGHEAMDGAYWSLAVEINFYIWMALFVVLGWLGRIEKIMWVWLCLSILNLVRPMYPLQLYANVQWAPFFSAGILFFLIRDAGWSRQRILLLMMSGLLACIYGWQEVGASKGGMDFMGISGDLRHITVVLLIMSGYSLFAWVAAPRSQASPSRVADLMGRVTYPLYLIHQNAGYAMLSVAASAGASSAFGLTSIALGLACLAIAVAWLVNVSVERRVGPWLRRAILGQHDAVDRPAHPHSAR